MTLSAGGIALLRLLACNNHEGESLFPRRSFLTDLGLSSAPTGVEIGAAQKYDLEEEGSVDAAMAVLKESAVRVVISIGLDADTSLLAAAAQKHGMLGEGYVWLKPDGFSPETYVQEATDPQLAVDQMTGWLMMDMTGLSGAAEARFQSVLRKHPVEELQSGHPRALVTEKALNSGPCSGFCAYLYDAVWLTALAASKTKRDTDGRLDREALLHAIRTTAFEGSSGLVDLDASTGDRDAGAMTMVLRNLQPGTDASGRPQVRRRTVWLWNEGEGITRVVPDDEPPFWHRESRGWETPSDGASCNAGYVFSEDRLVCAACPAGTHESGARCLPCAPGSVAPFAGMTKCNPCREGYAERSGQTECVACPAHSARTPASPGVNASECVCLAGFYSADGKKGGACTACPTGAVCSGGTRVPYPRPGFWGDRACQQHGGATVCPGWPQFVECNPAGSCEGGPEFKCKRGRTGQMCAVVEKGWTVVGDVFWFECGRNGWIWTILGMLGVFGIWFGINGLASSEYIALSVALLFVQITALISSFGLKWHRNLETLNLVLGVANFDVDFVPPNCISDWGPVSSFYFQLLLPIGFGACYAFYFSLTAAWQKWRTGELEAHFIRKRMWRSTRKNTLSICCIVYTTLALKCFSVFRCATFPDGAEYMALAPQVRCWQGKHLGMVIVSALYIPLVLLGLPAFIFLVLRHRLKQGTLHTENAMWQWSFLHSSYEADYKWWECMLMLRRCLVALITVAVDEPMLQAAATIAVLTAMLAAHSYSRPYILASVDALDFACLCGSILYVLGGMLMYPSVAQRAQGYICDGRDEEMEIFCGKDQDIKDAVSAVCLGAVLLTLLIAATITLHSVRQSRDSKKAMRIIDDAFQRSSSAKDLMATVNKVRLDEILDGTMLLKWVDQPVFDRTASTSASAYLRTDAQLSNLSVDMTAFSTGAVAATMRHLCEIEGLIDYLSSRNARVQQLREFLEHVAEFTETQNTATKAHCLRRFPLTAMTKFEFRPLLGYWLMVAREEDRHRFAKILQGILRSNGIETAAESAASTRRLLDLRIALDSDSAADSETRGSEDLESRAHEDACVTADSVFATVAIEDETMHVTSQLQSAAMARDRSLALARSQSMPAWSLRRTLFQAPTSARTAVESAAVESMEHREGACTAPSAGPAAVAVALQVPPVLPSPPPIALSSHTGTPHPTSGCSPKLPPLVGLLGS